jgi:hypothetical protein
MREILVMVLFFGDGLFVFLFYLFVLGEVVVG